MPTCSEIHGDHFCVQLGSRGTIKNSFNTLRSQNCSLNHIISNKFPELFPRKIPIALDSLYKHLSLWLGTKLATQATILQLHNTSKVKGRKKPFSLLHISKRIFIGDQVWRGNRNVDGFHHYFVPSNSHVTFLDQCLCQEPFTGFQRLTQIRKSKKKTVSEQ